MTFELATAFTKALEIDTYGGLEAWCESNGATQKLGKAVLSMSDYVREGTEGIDEHLTMARTIVVIMSGFLASKTATGIDAVLEFIAVNPAEVFLKFTELTGSIK